MKMKPKENHVREDGRMTLTVMGFLVSVFVIANRIQCLKHWLCFYFYINMSVHFWTLLVFLLQEENKKFYTFPMQQEFKSITNAFVQCSHHLIKHLG